MMPCAVAYVLLGMNTADDKSIMAYFEHPFPTERLLQVSAC